MRRSAAALFIFLCLAQTSCSTKFAYNFLDWAIKWKIKSYVSLHGEQKDFMKEVVENFHQWHRRTQLPQYAQYLDSVAAQLEQEPFSAAQIHRETDKVQALVDQSLQHALPELSLLAAQLDDEQVQELLDKVADKRLEFVEEYVDISLEKQAKKRYKDFVEHFKPWVGSLNKQQKQRIRTWARAIKPYEALHVQQQLRWEALLKDTLAQRADLPTLQAGLSQLMFYRTDDWIPELEAILDINQALTYEMVEQLLRGLSTKQHQHMLDKLRDYAKTCRELAAKAEQTKLTKSPPHTVALD